MTSDSAARLSQYRTMAKTGPNYVMTGEPTKDPDKAPPDVNYIIAGQSEVGGDEVAG
jgi:hypothetical protein